MSNPIIDLSLESIRLNARDVAALMLVAFSVFGLYGRFTNVELGLIELRISTLNMELSYMDGKERDETEQRVYDGKKLLVKILTEELEELQ